ncbi:hypothetical protein [Streptomyces carpaticus]|uniref:hypothetical protein n=1 Tax=Streptomyces carpaticus TaxID=285558 RepID=UPI0031F9314B
MELPPVHKAAELVEVVRIVAPVSLHDTEELTGVDVALWEGEQVQRTLALISGLPTSEIHRCFDPGWGVRVHGPEDVLFRIAFCFSCHGARLWGPGVDGDLDGIQPFDPDSPPARELLRQFRAAARG